MTPTTGTVMALVNHPNLDLLLGPVLVELQKRGHAVKALVVEYGRPDRLAAMGVPLVDELTEFDAFLAADGARVMINAADMIPQHRLGIHTDMLCRGAGVPTLTLEHAPFSLGYDDEFPPHVDFAADVMAVIGAEDERRYRLLDVDPSRLVVTGSPEFDGLVRARQAHDDAASSAIAVFGQSHTWTGKGSSQGIATESWRDELSRLYRLLAERYPHDRIRVKPHPAELLRGTEPLYHQAVPPDLTDRVEILPSDTDNAAVILHSRFVISFSSTIWLETKILGRPCAFFTLQERTGSLARDIPAMGGVWIPGRSVDFTARLRPHLDELDGQVAAAAGNIPDHLEAYTGPLDGQSAQRVAAAAEQLLVAGAPRVPMPVLVFDNPHKDPRRLRPETSYADYVHLQAVAEACGQSGVPQPAVLGITADPGALRRFLPLAFFTGHAAPITDSSPLPYGDASFDCVAAPDLLLNIAEHDRAPVLAELLRITRHKVVTSLPTALGRDQWWELLSLVAMEPGVQEPFAGRQDLEKLDAWLHDTPGCKVRIRPCHQVMSWSQSLIIEHLGLDAEALNTLRLSAQATGYPSEDQGRCARRIYTLIPER